MARTKHRENSIRENEFRQIEFWISKFHLKCLKVIRHKKFSCMKRWWHWSLKYSSVLLYSISINFSLSLFLVCKEYHEMRYLLLVSLRSILLFILWKLRWKNSCHVYESFICPWNAKKILYFWDTIYLTILKICYPQKLFGTKNWDTLARIFDIYSDTFASKSVNITRCSSDDKVDFNSQKMNYFFSYIDEVKFDLKSGSWKLYIKNICFNCRNLFFFYCWF